MIFLLHLGTVLAVWYFSFYFDDFSIRFMNCSDSVILYIFPFISVIFLLDLGTVLTVWYFSFGIFPFISTIFLLDLGTVLTVRHFFNFPFISMIFLLYL